MSETKLETIERTLGYAVDRDHSFHAEGALRLLREYRAARRSELSDEDLARFFHETYERLAPHFGYETRDESAVPWEQVPWRNRLLMIAVAGKIRIALELERGR